MSRRNKKEEKKPVKLNETAQQRVTSIIVELNRYLAAARDILNIPTDWVVTNNQNGVPSGFAPPKVKEEK